MTKQFYETPTTKTLVVRFQGVLCGSNTFNPNGTEQGNSRDGGDEGFLFE